MVVNHERNFRRFLSNLLSKFLELQKNIYSLFAAVVIVLTASIHIQPFVMHLCRLITKFYTF